MATFTASVPVNVQWFGNELIGAAGASYQIPDALATEFANSVGRGIPGFAWVSLIDDTSSFGISVKAYGAKGDNATNDTAAINLAIAAGGMVFFPAGTYLCNLDLTALADVTFRGDGAKSWLKPYSLATYALKITQSNRIRIEDLCFNGAWTDGQTALKGPTFFQGITDIAIRRCRFNNSRFRAIDFRLDVTTVPPQNGRVRVESCTFTNNELDPIYIGNASDIEVIGNYIADAPDTGIDTGEATLRTLIVGNTLSSCHTGIYSAATQGQVVIADNVVAGCTGNGISLASYDANAAGASVTGNIISGPTTAALSAIAADLANTVISGNYIFGFGSYQVRVTKPNVHLTGNFFDTPVAAAAINVTSGRCTVANNKFLLGASGLAGVISSSAGTALVVADNVFAGGDPAVQVSGRDSVVARNVIYASRNGILITGSSATACLVEDNAFFSSVFTTGDIVEASSADGNLIRRNKVSAATQITPIGASTKVRQNDLYLTENSGTATVASGATTAVVSHGLKVTPALKDISVTATNSMGSATKFWITTPTATQFTINVDVDPGATTATFVWDARIR